MVKMKEEMVISKQLSSFFAIFWNIFFLIKKNCEKPHIGEGGEDFPDVAEVYQTLHRCSGSGFIGDPDGQLNASAKSGWL